MGGFTQRIRHAFGKPLRREEQGVKASDVLPLNVVYDLVSYEKRL